MKANFTDIQMNSAAFEDNPATELARILRELAADIERGVAEKILRDLNGNQVGSFRVSE